MPQVNATFKPKYWTQPRPATFGEGASAVVPVAGGDRRHLFKRQPEPGAGAWALIPDMPKMAFSLAGPGYIVRDNGASQILSGPQVRWSGAQVVTGINGQVYSGSYQQGLVDYAAFVTGLPMSQPVNMRG